MIDECSNNELKNNAQVVYSYDNSEQTITKITQSNTTSVKVYKYNYRKIGCIKSFVNLRELCLNRQEIFNLCIKGNPEIYNSYIKYYGNKKYLIINLRLGLRIYYNRYNPNQYYETYSDYEYKIPVEKNRINEINVHILDIDYAILSRDEIKVNTVLEFSF